MDNIYVGRKMSLDEYRAMYTVPDTGMIIEKRYPSYLINTSHIPTARDVFSRQF